MSGASNTTESNINSNENNIRSISTSKTIIFDAQSLSFDYSQCSMLHHVNWQFFLVYCISTSSPLLYRFNYTINYIQTDGVSKTKWTTVDCDHYEAKI